MKDELTESMKNYCHLQRTPSVSARDKEQAVLPRAPVDDSGDQWTPDVSLSLSAHKHLLCVGQLKLLTGLAFLRTHVKLNLVKGTFILSLVQVTTAPCDLLHRWT